MSTNGLSKKASQVFLALAVSAAAFGCGKEESGMQNGILLQSNPLAGASQAGLFERFIGIQNAYAAVTAFNTFKVCVSEVVWELQSGAAGSSATAPLKPGLLDFSPTSTSAMSIGYLDLTAGTVLKNIKFTIATKPELCSNADYAVLFNAGSSGDKKVTQDMSFQFDFASGGYTVENGKAITVYLGDIVNGMATLGSSLDNSTIQTVDVGQAK